MKYTELNSEDEIFQVLKEHWYVDEESVLPPMFHGTDLSLLDISQKDRDYINGACETIMKSILELFYDNSIELPNTILSSVKGDHQNAADAFTTARERIKNNPLYRYGDLYCTNDPQRAIGYSNEAWILGESGETSYLLINGASELGLELPKDKSFEQAYALIYSRSQRPKSPVVLIITDCAYSELYFNEGTNVKDNEEKFFPGGVKNLKKKEIYDSYRISEKTLLNDARIYMVRSDLYDGLLKAYDRI